MMRGIRTWAVVFVAYVLADALLAMALLRGTPGTPGALPASLLASAIVVAAAVAIATRLAGRGLRRTLVLFSLLFVPQVNNFVELIIFPLDLRAQLAATLILKVGLLSAVVAATLDACLPAGPAERSCWPARRRAAGWLARLLTCDLAYVIVYVTAGMIVWPFVRPFYEHRTMPAMGTILSMQVLRGLVFVALLAGLAHELRARRAMAILLGGVALSVFSASDLLVPNPFMPDFARWAHLCEVGTSNFLFGAFVTWMLTVPARSAPSAALPDPASGARGVA
jgi:hypothetical protein